MYVEVSANGAVLHCVLMMSCSTSALGAVTVSTKVQCAPKVLCC